MERELDIAYVSTAAAYAVTDAILTDAEMMLLLILPLLDKLQLDFVSTNALDINGPLG